MNWKRIKDQDLPNIGDNILLAHRPEGYIEGDVMDVKPATFLLDQEGTPPDTYFDVWGDQQYSVFEYWTHWAPLELPNA